MWLKVEVPESWPGRDGPHNHYLNLVSDSELELIYAAIIPLSQAPLLVKVEHQMSKKEVDATSYLGVIKSS